MPTKRSGGECGPFGRKPLTGLWGLAKLFHVVYDTNMSTPTKLLTTREAATLLNVSVRRITQFCKSGRLRGQKVGRDWLLTQADVSRFRRIPRPIGRPGKPGKVKGG